MKRFNTTGTCFPQLRKLLTSILDVRRLIERFVVNFCFNRNKQPGIHEVAVGEKKIIEAVV